MRKNWFKIFFACLFFCTFLLTSYAQESDKHWSLFINPNHSLLDSYMSNEVEFFDADGHYFTGKQLVMSKFQSYLKNVEAQKVEPMHHGNSKSKSTQYKVAKLIAKKGTFRIFLYLEQQNGDNKIKEIRIEKY